MFNVKKITMMINAIVKRFEDPERPLLGPNYWAMRKMGLILPKSKTGKYLYILIHEVLTFFVITEYIELYVIRSDTGDVLKNLQMSMLATVAVAKTISFLLWQDSWAKVIDYVTDADKIERENRDEVTGKIIDNYTKYCRKGTYFTWCMVCVTYGAFTHVPFMRFLTSSEFRNDLANGTEPFPHIISSWVPFDKYRSPGCWITVVWQFSVCAYGTFSMATYDTTVIAIMVFFGGKLELIRERCKRMMGSRGKGISEAQADMRIRQIHCMHVQLTKNFKLFNSLMSPVMFLYVMMCSLMLCASAYRLTSASNAMQNLIMAMFLVSGIAQLFVFCWHSHDVLLRSQNVSLGPYESEWWAASVRQRKSLLLLTGQLRTRHMLTAGPFTNLSLPTFIAILKRAYCYYILLRK